MASSRDTINPVGAISRRAPERIENENRVVPILLLLTLAAVLAAGVFVAPVLQAGPINRGPFECLDDPELPWRCLVQPIVEAAFVAQALEDNCQELVTAIPVGGEKAAFISRKIEGCVIAP